MCIDKLMQELMLYQKGKYEDALYLYHTLIDALRYGTSIEGAVGMHIIDELFNCYSDDYKWCNHCDYAAYTPTSTNTTVLKRNKTESKIKLKAVDFLE